MEGGELALSTEMSWKKSCAQESTGRSRRSEDVGAPGLRLQLQRHVAEKRRRIRHDIRSLPQGAAQRQD